jgi:hypothetical protein
LSPEDDDAWQAALCAQIDGEKDRFLNFSRDERTKPGSRSSARRDTLFLPSPLLVSFRLFTQRRLGRSQSGDRHAEWRAAHVIHADFVAEVDAVRVAAMFATNADFEVLVVLRLTTIAAFLDADVDQLADAVDVDRLEGVDG